MKKAISVIVSMLIVLAGIISCSKPASFYKVVNGQFSRNGAPYYFVGTNFWYGSILGSEGQGGNRERLAAELDTLKALGIENLRVMVGSDGEPNPSKAYPSLQTTPGNYNDTLLRGLDYFMSELDRRDMSAVLFINNAWEWTGGYEQYLEWCGYGKAPIPNVDGWDKYQPYVRNFVMSDTAKALFAKHVKFIVSRVNTVTGKPYSEDPAIFSWQIGNEPRVFSTDSVNKAVFVQWLQQTAQLIKSIDPNHMVSIGSEGYHGCEDDWKLYEKCASIPEIDYINMHIWPYNWEWIDRKDPASGVTACIEKAIDSTNAYIANHVAIAGKVNKPLVCEEFGYPRDSFKFVTSAPASARDSYYKNMFEQVVRNKAEGGKFAGCNFWGWGGFGEPAHTYWQVGDDYLGDPAQEQQGLNTVFVTDSSTVHCIEKYSSLLK